MIIFTPLLKSESKTNPSPPKYDGVKMSLEQYLSYSFEEETYKYEWNEGILESEKKKMKIKEAILFRNLRNRFIKNYPSGKYEILSEITCPLSTQKKVRIPDIGIFNYEDIKNYTSGNSLVPILAIELISPSNQAEELEQKIKEYFLEGVKSVWCIYPNLKQIKIHESIKQTTNYSKSETCTFNYSELQFSISVNELFQDFS